MLTIRNATREDPMYEKVSDFAKTVYGKKLHAMIVGRPDIFTYITAKEMIIGCFGLYEGGACSRLLFETYFSDDVFEKFFHVSREKRSLIGELGTRAVMIPDDIQVGSNEVSAALAASIILIAAAHGIHYLGFTANRSVRRIADTLEIQMLNVGEPDLSKKDEVFRENWKEFFRIKQQCFMIDLTHPLIGCKKTLRELTKKGFIVESKKLRALYTSQ